MNHSDVLRRHGAFTVGRCSKHGWNLNYSFLATVVSRGRPGHDRGENVGPRPDEPHRRHSIGPRRRHRKKRRLQGAHHHPRPTRVDSKPFSGIGNNTPAQGIPVDQALMPNRPSLRRPSARLFVFSAMMAMVRAHKDGVFAVAPGHQVGNKVEHFFAREAIEQPFGHQRNR